MRLSVVGGSALAVCLIVSLTTFPVAAEATCLASNDARQAQLDQAGVESALAGGLSLRVVRQCAGFSVVVEDSIDATVAEEYATYAQSAYTHLASETGNTLSPRAVLFVFPDLQSMATGERVVAGITRPMNEPRAGYAWLNTVWLDNSQNRSKSKHAQAVAHEFSHLFASVTTKGRTIPAWFDEGLAVDSEIALSADAFPVASQARAGQERIRVLEALSGDGPIELFALGELASHRSWQEHYVNPNEQHLEYAQAHETVRAAMGSRGRAGAWSVLREMGNGHDFETAFLSQIGRTVEQVDAAARASWQVELAAEPEPLKFSVHIAPSTDAAQVVVSFVAYLNATEFRISGPVTPGSTIVFDVLPDGSIVQPASDLAIESQAADEDELDYFGTWVSVSIERPDGTGESVSMTRTYGRWDPDEERTLFDPGADKPFRSLDGKLSDPFPSGDTIVAVAGG